MALIEEHNAEGFRTCARFLRQRSHRNWQAKTDEKRIELGGNMKTMPIAPSSVLALKQLNLFLELFAFAQVFKARREYYLRH